MITVFAVVSYSLIVFLVYKKLNNRYQQELFKRRMYELRDELRMLAIDKKVKGYSQEFDYLDYSISKTIEQSYYITLFYIAFLELKHSHNLKNIKAYKAGYEALLERICSNDELKIIFNKKNIYVTQYLAGQNRFTKAIYKFLKIILAGAFNLHKSFKQKVAEVNYFPELSGLRVNLN